MRLVSRSWLNLKANAWRCANLADGLQKLLSQAKYTAMNEITFAEERADYGGFVAHWNDCVPQPVFSVA